MFSKILLPIDLAETQLTERSLSMAAALAKKFDAELRIVNIQTLVPISFLDYVPEHFEAEIKLGLEEELAALVKSVDLPADRVSTKLLYGPVYPKTLDEAKDWGADVIIVASHNPGLERFLIGSNAEAIVSHARCSVLVLRS